MQYRRANKLFSQPHQPVPETGEQVVRVTLGRSYQPETVNCPKSNIGENSIRHVKE